MFNDKIQNKVLELLESKGYSFIQYEKSGNNYYLIECTNSHGDDVKSIWCKQLDDGILIGSFSKKFKPCKIEHTGEITYNPEYDRTEVKSKGNEVFQLELARIKKGIKKVDTHPYAEKKKIKGPFLEYRNNLVVSGTDENGKCAALQFINADSGKWFLSGSNPKTYNHVLKNKNTKNAILSEGYATAKSIALAVSDYNVFCTFGVSSLHTVKDILTKRGFQVIVAGDNPNGNHQVESILRTLTHFSPQVDDLSDYNDVYCKYGLNRLKKEVYIGIQQSAPQKPQVINLNEDGSINVLSKRTNTIIKIDSLQKLMRVKHFLAAPSFFKLYEYTDDKGKKKTNYTQILEDLINESSRASNKNVDMYKGFGVYREGDLTIFNSGNSRNVYNHKTKKFNIEYGPKVLTNGNIYINNQGSEVCMDDVKDIDYKDIRNLCELVRSTYKFVCEPSPEVLVGWALQAIYASFSPFCANTWLHGPSGSGKSKVPEIFLRGLLNDVAILDIDGTVAGIVQDLNVNGVPQFKALLYDEAEIVEMSKNSKAEDIVPLIRNAATANKHTKSRRGTPEGNVKLSVTKFASNVSSIVPSIKHEQDRARFLEIPMKRNNHDDKVSKYTAFNKTMESIGNSFVKFAIKSADEYTDRYNDCLSLVYRDLPDEVGHKPSTISSIMAGMCIALQIKAGEAFENIKPLLKEEIKLASRNDNEVDVVGIINNLVLKPHLLNSSSPIRLVDALKNDLYKHEIKANYGVFIKEKDGKEYIAFSISKKGYSVILSNSMEDYTYLSKYFIRFLNRTSGVIKMRENNARYTGVPVVESE